MQLRDTQIPEHEHSECILCKSGLLFLTGVMRNSELLNTIWRDRFLMSLFKFFSFDSKYISLVTFCTYYSERKKPKHVLLKSVNNRYFLPVSLPKELSIENINLSH